jgi:uncharacterized protein (TIGR03435 family)
MNPSKAMLCSTCSGSLRHKLYKTVAPFLLVLAAALPACAQVQARGNSGQAVASAPATPKTSGASKLAFDAASVRLSSQKGIKGMDFLSSQSYAEPPKGGFFSWNVRVMNLIDFGYGLRNAQMAEEVWKRLPDWARYNEFAIEARAEGNPTRDDVRQMVRSLLEDRFQFAGHFEKREGQVYALVVNKPGLGLKPHPEGADCTLSSSQVDENKYPHVFPTYKVRPARCGIFDRELGQAWERRYEMLDVTMQQIADFFSEYGSSLVVDKTGLAGRYDAVLDISGAPPNADSATSDELGLPPLPVALEKQLGLKLVKQNAKVDVFVIDHIGTLSEN